MPSGSQASFRPRQNLDYDQEKEQYRKDDQGVRIHPLHPKYEEVQEERRDQVTSQEIKKEKKKKDMTTTINADFDDPLSMMLR